MTKQQLALTLKTLSVFLWGRTTLIRIFDKENILRPPSYAYEPKDRKTATNIGLAIWRLKCFYETFVPGSTEVILLNICAEKPVHRKFAKRQVAKKLKQQSKLYGY